MSAERLLALSNWLEACVPGLLFAHSRPTGVSRVDRMGKISFTSSSLVLWLALFGIICYRSLA